MADLDFSHNVSEIPAGKPLPSPYQREAKPEAGFGVPDLQGAISNYADATNWKSALGSNIATKASNAIATKIGGELGKNPQGDIGIPLTDFDKTMQESYRTQAEATLGLQANKLILDSNIEAAKATRITPELIQKTNQSIALGLKNIFKNAPSELQPHLEYQFGNAMLNQTNTLTNRMIGEQKEDRRNNTALATSMNLEHAYSFALNGNDKAGLDAVENTKKLANADVAARLMTPQAAKTNIDAARQSFYSGKLAREYEAKRAEGKGEEYLKSLADKKPSYISDSDYDSVINNLTQYVNQKNALRSQNEALVTSKLNVRMAQDINSITPSELAEYQNQVSPLQYEKTLFTYTQQKKKAAVEEGQSQALVANWGDSGVLTRATAKQINSTFDKLVSNRMQSDNLTKDDAEVQVALSAGKPVPVFVDSLNAKATSGNPINIDSAYQQFQSLKDMEGGHALIGLSSQAQAIMTQFQHQKGSMPDSDLARKITDNILNTNKDTQKIIDNVWEKKLSKAKVTGQGGTNTFANFALEQVNLAGKNLGGSYFNTIYGNDIYDQLKSNFDTTKGDYPTALKMTQDYVDHHYAETRVNGGVQTTDSPIEKVLGYKDPGVVPFIQQDVVSQLSNSFARNRDPNDYWEAKPVNLHQDKPLFGVFKQEFPPVELVRHVKTDKGMQQFTYPVNLVGRPGGTWDIALQTPNGPRNIFLVAPHLGITTYKPNAENIRINYKNAYLLGGL